MTTPEPLGLTEKDYLDIVERIQQAMCVEPFQPGMADVVRLIEAWRGQQHKIERLHAEIEQWIARLRETTSRLESRLRECDAEQQEIVRLRIGLHRVAESRRGQRERAERAEQEITVLREQLAESESDNERLLVDNAELGRECDQYQVKLSEVWAEVARLRAETDRGGPADS